jgi:shikimate 5-dehydrogenase
VRSTAGIVYDLVYNPMDTRLLKEAAAAGCETIGGLDMLVAQAEDQSEWWLGRRPPSGLMRQAALGRYEANILRDVYRARATEHLRARW